LTPEEIPSDMYPLFIRNPHALFVNDTRPGGDVNIFACIVAILLVYVQPCGVRILY
jgi:hypothetical protein